MPWFVNATIEKTRLQDGIFGLNENGELESLGSRKDLESLKSEFQRLQILLAGVGDVAPSSDV